MARVLITLNDLVGTAGAAEVATTADPTLDHYLDCTSVPLEEIVLRFANTNGTDRVATIAVGDSPPALEAGLGVINITVPATTGVMCIGNLASGRFIQSDGTVNIDLAASFAGTITAYRCPRTS